MFPVLPAGWESTFIIVAAVLGSILLVYSIFIEQEHRQDIIRMLGAGGLLTYALAIEEPFFAIAMAAIAIASLVEFAEIYFGLHKHSKEDLKKYKQLWRHKQ